MSRRHGDIRKLIPSDYSVVDCIISSGQQWIDTGIACTESTGGMVDMNLLSNASKPYMLACYKNGVRGYLIGCETPNYAYGYGNVRFVNTSINFPTNERHEFKTMFANGHQYAAIDDHVIYQTALSGSFTTDNIALSLFALQNSYAGSMQQYCKAKLYAATLWQNDIAVRDFVPVIRLQDNKPGLYDIIGQAFYVNQGTDNDFSYE